MKLVAVTFRGERFFESGKARKVAECHRCDKAIGPGDPVFRPLGNTVGRYLRLHAGCAQGVAEAAPGNALWDRTVRA